MAHYYYSYCNCLRTHLVRYNLRLEIYDAEFTVMSIRNLFIER